MVGNTEHCISLHFVCPQMGLSLHIAPGASPLPFYSPFPKGPPFSHSEGFLTGYLLEWLVLVQQPGEPASTIAVSHMPDLPLKYSQICHVLAQHCIIGKHVFGSDHPKE